MLSRRKPATPCPDADKTCLGSVLLRLGRINEQQLKEAVSDQSETGDALLGVTLRRMGYVTAMDVALAMKIQAELREGRRVHAELDVLQAKVDETEAGAKELSLEIARVRNKRRQRGENSGIFSAYTPALRLAT